MPARKQYNYDNADLYVCVVLALALREFSASRCLLLWPDTTLFLRPLLFQYVCPCGLEAARTWRGRGWFRRLPRISVTYVSRWGQAFCRR